MYTKPNSQMFQIGAIKCCVTHHNLVDIIIHSQFHTQPNDGTQFYESTKQGSIQIISGAIVLKDIGGLQQLFSELKFSSTYRILNPSLTPNIHQGMIRCCMSLINWLSFCLLYTDTSSSIHYYDPLLSTGLFKEQAFRTREAGPMRVGNSHVLKRF